MENAPVKTPKKALWLRILCIAVALLLLLGLAVVVTFNDIIRLF